MFDSKKLVERVKGFVVSWNVIVHLVDLTGFQWVYFWLVEFSDQIAVNLTSFVDFMFHMVFVFSNRFLSHLLFKSINE